MALVLTPSQESAVAQLADWYGARARPEFYLDGFAGVGKSTVASTAIDRIKDQHKVGRVITGAYTGKAAHVLRKKGISDARTIHSMIYMPEEDPHTGKIKFRLSLDAPASEADLIAVDERSMVSEELATDLRKFGKPILAMGDPGQLPPVKGRGAFNDRPPDVFLSEVLRQAADSPILDIATRARQGRYIPLGDYSPDVRVLELNRDTQELVYRPDTQVICGVHRVRWTYTQRIRRRLGFADLLDELSAMPMRGERVICCRNEKSLGLFNGALGTVISDPKVLDNSGVFEMDVKMDDIERPLKEVAVHPWLFRQHFGGTMQRPKIGKEVTEFDWGYVLTCHKAQGSEFDHVTIIDDSRSFREDSAKWLYTAVTRAAQGLTLLKRAS